MSIQPLLIHLLFHPQSNSARGLAQHIHRQLNDDVVVPGLRVPTVFCPISGDTQPPTSHRLDISNHSFVVLLADDDLVVDDHWCQFVADVWEACNASEKDRHRCVPFQLTESAWPLDDRLRGVNFGRAFAHVEGEERNLWVTRRVVIELCRFLEGVDTADDQSRVPMNVFLSHAKADLNTAPFVAKQFISYLTSDQPVESWVDSGKIETGSKFAVAIGNGVKQTSLLAILTDRYSSREWCREEVMLAKEHQRPIVVVDALMTHEARTFPFLDNVPRLRWNGNPEDGIDLLLKETLRHLHVKTVLESSKRPSDTVFLRPPEPATLLGVAPGSSVLYPDPPLGVGELRRLSKSKVTFSTPLERSGHGSFLDGRLIALSMSESTDIARWGMDQLHLTQTMLELSRHLLIKGASLAYGGHLGQEGYTSRLFELVRAHNSQEGVEPFKRIINHRAWPLPTLSKQQRAEIKLVSTIVPIERPADVDESLHHDLTAEIPTFFPGNKSPIHRYAWCRGMTELRSFQADYTRSHVVAKVVLGGTFGRTFKVAEDGTNEERWYSGRMPGVLEEILLSIRAGQPVFLIGAFGGVAKLAIDLMLGQGHPAASWDIQSQAPFASETRDLYAKYSQNWWYYDEENRIDGLPVDEQASIVEFLANTWESQKVSGWGTGINPLTPDENIELFNTVDCAKMVALLQRGLAAIG